MRFFILLFGSLALLPAQTLSIASGNGQIVLEQFLTTVPLVARATDAAGKPLAGVNITWSITQGSGTIEGLPTTPTDANGLAGITFLATGVPPGISFMPVTVTATAGASSVNFALVTVLSRFPAGGIAAPPLEQLLTPDPSGPGISGAAGTTLPGAIKVLVTAQSGSQAGQPIANAGVRVIPNTDPSKPSAACNAPAGIVLTDIHGLATCDLVLGSQTGTTRISVEVGEAVALPGFVLTVTPGPACTYSISPIVQNFSAAANLGTVTVTTAAGCTWTASASDTWITPAQTGGTGSGVLNYSVTADPTTTRTGSLTVAGQVLSISQSGAGGPQPIAIATGSNLPFATVGAAYSTALTATGGSGSYTWTLNGTLPPGLTFSAGKITGTPTTAGTSTFSISVTDTNNGAPQSQSFTLAVLPAGVGLTITNAAFPNGIVGQPYQQTLTSTPGCSTPFSPVPVFRLAGGTLPSGLSVQPINDRVFGIAGTPTAAGTYSFTLSATDACGTVTNANFSIAITSVSGPLMTAAPSSLQFAAPFSNQSVSISSPTPLAYQATASTTSGGSWIAIGNPNGTTPGTISVGIVNTSQLAPGVYNGSISIASTAANSPIVIPVTLTIAVPATLAVSPPSVAAGLPNYGSTISQQTILLTSTGAPLPFTATASTVSGGSWLYVSVTQGFTPAPILAILNASGLPSGAYSGSILVSSPAGQQTIPVSLTVTSPPIPAASPSTLTFTYAAGVATPAPQTVTISGFSGSFTTSVSTASGGSWLSIASSAANPTQLTVTANPAGLAAGNYSGLVSIQPVDPTAQVLFVPVTFSVGPGAPSIASVTNAASFAPGSIAPGEFITVFGTGMGPGNGTVFALNSAGAIGPTLAGTRVLFDDVAAPLIYSSSGQVSAIVPYNLTGRASSMVSVEYLGVRSTPVNVRVVDSSPAIFTLDASGQGAIINQDGTVNSAQNRAPIGSIVSIYATGAGQTTPAGNEGQVTGFTTPFPQQVLPVSVQIGGLAAQLFYAGAAPGLPAGIIQVNAKIPQITSTSTPASVVLFVGSAQSPSVNVWVR